MTTLTVAFPPRGHDLPFPTCPISLAEPRAGLDVIAIAPPVTRMQGVHPFQERCLECLQRRFAGPRFARWRRAALIHQGHPIDAPAPVSFILLGMLGPLGNRANLDRS